MADLLRQGLTLTELACPHCSSPLVRRKNGDLWCARCEKKVIVLKEGEDPQKITSFVILENLETALLTKAQELQKKVQNEETTEELLSLIRLISELMETIAKIRKVKRG